MSYLNVLEISYAYELVLNLRILYTFLSTNIRNFEFVLSQICTQEELHLWCQKSIIQSIIKYILIVYFFDVVEINTVDYKVGQIYDSLLRKKNSDSLIHVVI